MTEATPKHAISLATLLVLTIVTATVASTTHAVFIILGISMVKVLLVAFRFMDLRHAHLFWKTAFVLLSFSILTAIAVLANGNG